MSLNFPVKFLSAYNRLLYKMCRLNDLESCYGTTGSCPISFYICTLIMWTCESWGLLHIWRSSGVRCIYFIVQCWLLKYVTQEETRQKFTSSARLVYLGFYDTLIAANCWPASSLFPPTFCSSLANLFQTIKIIKISFNRLCLSIVI